MVTGLTVPSTVYLYTHLYGSGWLAALERLGEWYVVTGLMGVLCIYTGTYGIGIRLAVGFPIKTAEGFNGERGLVVTGLMVSCLANGDGVWYWYTVGGWLTYEEPERKGKKEKERRQCKKVGK